MFKRLDLRNLWWKTAFIVVFMLGIFSFCHPEANGWQANDALFTDAASYAVPSAQIERERQDPTIRRSRHVPVNIGLLHRPEVLPSQVPFNGTELALPSAQEGTIMLNLFTDVSFKVVKHRIEMRSVNRYTWFGHIDGVEDSQAILVVEDGDMAGSIIIPAANYQIRPVGGNIQAVYEIDTSAYPSEADPIPVYTGTIIEASPPTAACCDVGSI